jgi:hypothetical protein
VEYFLSLCDTDDAVLGTHFVERFLYYATRNHYDGFTLGDWGLIKANIETAFYAVNQGSKVTIIRKYSNTAAEGRRVVAASGHVLINRIGTGTYLDDPVFSLPFSLWLGHCALRIRYRFCPTLHRELTPDCIGT